MLVLRRAMMRVTTRWRTTVAAAGGLHHHHHHEHGCCLLSSSSTKQQQQGGGDDDALTDRADAESTSAIIRPKPTSARSSAAAAAPIKFQPRQREFTMIEKAVNELKIAWQDNKDNKKKSKTTNNNTNTTTTGNVLIELHLNNSTDGATDQLDVLLKQGGVFEVPHGIGRRVNVLALTSDQNLLAKAVRIEGPDDEGGKRRGTPNTKNVYYGEFRVDEVLAGRRPTKRFPRKEVLSLQEIPKTTLSPLSPFLNIVATEELKFRLKQRPSIPTDVGFRAILKHYGVFPCKEQRTLVKREEFVETVQQFVSGKIVRPIKTHNTPSSTNHNNASSGTTATAALMLVGNLDNQKPKHVSENVDSVLKQAICKFQLENIREAFLLLSTTKKIRLDLDKVVLPLQDREDGTSSVTS